MSLTEEEKAVYQTFMDDFPFCMACGWRGRPWRPWMINRLVNAHLVGGAGRRHDRRAIVRLCDGCHLLSHGERINDGNGYLPKLTLGAMLWLKQRFDQEWFDLEYLNSIATGVMPELEEPAAWFVDQNRFLRG